jgi:hypothetical protein
VDKAITKVLKWALFGISFAVIPFGAVWWNLSHHGHLRIWLYQLWPHGELSLICVAVAADGIGEIVFDEKRKQDRAKILAAMGCTLILVMCTFLFAGAQFLSDSAVSDIKDYSLASMVMFGITIVCAGVCKVRTEA